MPSYAEKIEGLFSTEMTERKAPGYGSLKEVGKDAWTAYMGFRERKTREGKEAISLMGRTDLTKRETDKVANFVADSMDMGGILKPVAFAKLLKTAPRAFKGYSAETIRTMSLKHLVDMLKVPTEEFKGLTGMRWVDTMPLTTSGTYLIDSGEIVLNPYKFGKATSRHEFVHKREWQPRASEDELLASNYLRALREGLFQAKRWKYKIDPVEVHARKVEGLLAEGSNLSDAYEKTLRQASTYAPAEKQFSSRSIQLLKDVLHEQGGRKKFIAERELWENLAVGGKAIDKPWIKTKSSVQKAPASKVGELINVPGTNIKAKLLSEKDIPEYFKRYGVPNAINETPMNPGTLFGNKSGRLFIDEDTGKAVGYVPGRGSK